MTFLEQIDDLLVQDCDPFLVERLARTYISWRSIIYNQEGFFLPIPGLEATDDVLIMVFNEGPLHLEVVFRKESDRPPVFTYEWQFHNTKSGHRDGTLRPTNVLDYKFFAYLTTIAENHNA